MHGVCDHYPFHENHQEEILACALDINAGNLCHNSHLIAPIGDAWIPGVKHSVTWLSQNGYKHITYGLFWSVFIIKLQGFPVIHWYWVKKIEYPRYVLILKWVWAAGTEAGSTGDVYSCAALCAVVWNHSEQSIVYLKLYHLNLWGGNSFNL